MQKLTTIKKLLHFFSNEYLNIYVPVKQSDGNEIYIGRSEIANGPE